jgi:hypothetical protein
MKLSRAVNNRIVSPCLYKVHLFIKYPAYFGREDLRLVDVIDMACVTSGDMISLIEWAQTLPFFPKLPIDCRTNLLRRFAVFQLVLEAGFCTSKSPLNDIWLFPNGTCMTTDINCLPVSTRVSLFKPNFTLF